MWSALLLVGPPLALLLGEPIDELLVLGVVGVVALPVLLGGDEGGTAVTTSTGETKFIPKQADFGTLSSGGLY